MRYIYATSVRPSLVCLIAPLVLSASGCADAESRDAPSTEVSVPSEALDPASSAEAAPAHRTVPAGATLIFSTDAGVTTEIHAPGDEFTATLRGDAVDVEGATALVEGTQSRWIVSESSVRNGQALLALRLESIRVGDAWVPVVGSVVRADIDTDHPDTGEDSAVKVGVGAAAGALIGQMLGGDTRSTLTGAGVGAAAGGIFALSTRAGSATLPIGSTIYVRLDEPLTLT